MIPSVNDDFLTLVKRRLTDLQRQDSDLAAQEEGVRRKRAVVQNEINKLQFSAETYRHLMGIADEATPEQGLFGPDEAAGSVAEMAADIMYRNGGQAALLEIRDELARLGKVRPGQRGYGTVYASLSRGNRFVKVGPGVYGLTKHEMFLREAEQRGAQPVSGTIVVDEGGEVVEPERATAD